MRICVFCGSSLGAKSEYQQAAFALGRTLAERGIGLVYGGASVGLMGSVADAALEHGGEVIGVLPQALADLEIAHPGLTELRIVSSMHERKAQMADLSDSFIALPGGIGTLEETFEVWTWSQLSLHAKAVGLLNVAGFYDGLERFLDHLVGESFVKPQHRAILHADASPSSLIDKLTSAVIPTDKKWVDELRR
ncbi:TIGR00730 family Rossman fold protein [Hyphococcus sp.]|uniref:LOG family protein n=1 Tax=Hyphococcus sp. TaxID=2038636 RepID=UPI0020841F0E|nr:MAG: putative cytokinin riboside 5'-monophosphate phosphoribohydrolase [Marinicaulis sp.]